MKKFKVSIYKALGDDLRNKTVVFREVVIANRCPSIKQLIKMFPEQKGNFGETVLISSMQ